MSKKIKYTEFACVESNDKYFRSKYPGCDYVTALWLLKYLAKKSLLKTLSITILGNEWSSLVLNSHKKFLFLVHCEKKERNCKGKYCKIENILKTSSCYIWGPRQRRPKAALIGPTHFKTSLRCSSVVRRPCNQDFKPVTNHGCKEFICLSCKSFELSCKDWSDY